MKLSDMHITTCLIHALPAPDRRCYDRKEAASYVGVSVGTFDKLVREGEMPASIEFFGRRVWDRQALDVAVDAKMALSSFAAPAGADRIPTAISPLDAWRLCNG
jgi:excisionase family DNA binding protein